MVGTWTVTSSCLALSGDMDVTLASLGCKTVPVTGSLHVTGTWTANGDGTYTDNTVTTGSITFPLGPVVPVGVVRQRRVLQGGGQHLRHSAGPRVTCSSDAGGHCSCSATANQSGGIGVVSPWAMTSGNYTTSGSGLNVDSTWTTRTAPREAR